MKNKNNLEKEEENAKKKFPTIKGGGEGGISDNIPRFSITRYNHFVLLEYS